MKKKFGLMIAALALAGAVQAGEVTDYPVVECGATATVEPALLTQFTAFGLWGYLLSVNPLAGVYVAVAFIKTQCEGKEV